MSKLRVGIIGSGGRGTMSFGKNFVEQHADVVDLVALADTNTLRAEAAVHVLDRKMDIHDSVGDMVSRSDIDAVVVTTPDYLHEEHCLLAFEHGKHVLVDKPLAITGEGCLRVIEASKRADKVLYMGFNLRHDVVLRRLKTLVDQGAFGDVFSVQAIEHYNGGRSYMSALEPAEEVLRRPLHSQRFPRFRHHQLAHGRGPAGSRELLRKRLRLEARGPALQGARRRNARPHVFRVPLWPPVSRPVHSLRRVGPPLTWKTGRRVGRMWGRRRVRRRRLPQGPVHVSVRQGHP